MSNITEGSDSATTMSSPKFAPNFQFSGRGTRRSWSLSESDANKTLATVDEEEMFLFDEDLKAKGSAGGFRKTAPTKDLDNDCSDNVSDMFRSLNLNPRKTENFSPVYHKNVFFLHESREHFSNSHGSGSSPYFHEMGSSAESERSVSISIESLRNHLQSCATCGVLWRESQVSLDCLECGGYALDRPCPECDGACQSIWVRDVALTHQLNKAKWIGTCKHTKQ